ncbi:MAG: SIMPL domain-containing protein [Eubacteriales bacterium]
MNKNIIFVLIAILIIAGVGLCAYMITGSKDIPSIEDATTITVTGEGTVSTAPDTATLNIGVATTGDTAAEAQAENSDAMQDVLAALKAEGIAEEDIVTASYSIYPQYDYVGDTNIIIGYKVSNNLSVTLHDIDSVGTVLEKATEAGANMAGSISFSSSEADALYNEALALACDAAKEKGEVLADATGMKLKGLINLSEGIDYASSYAKSTTYFVAEETSSVPIETGQLTFDATVTVVYSVK